MVYKTPPGGAGEVGGGGGKPYLVCGLIVMSLAKFEGFEQLSEILLILALQLITSHFAHIAYIKHALI